MLYFNISLSRLVLFLSCLLLVSCGQHTDNASGVDLPYKLSIGDKRAFLNFPAKAKREQKFQQPSIVVPVDGAKIWFFCDELSSSGSATFFEDVKKKEKPDLKKTLLINNDTLVAVLLTPTVTDSSSKIQLIARLLVKESNNSMYEIRVCMDQSDLKKADKAKALSEAILKTLHKGTKPVDLSYRSPRDTTIDIPDTKKRFRFTLPANYYLRTTDNGIFKSTGFYRYSAYADSSTCQMKLKIQNIFREHVGSTWIDIDKAERTKGKFIGMHISWLTTYGKSHEAPGLVFERAQDINCEQIEAGCIVQFEMMSNNKAVIEELTTLAESFKLENQ